MRTFLAGIVLCALVLIGGMAFAQNQNEKGDLGLGFGTLVSTPSDKASGNYAPQSMGGGLYTTFSVNYLLRHHLGVSGELSWRDHQNLYEGYEPFRPLFYDINGLYERRLGKDLGFEAMAGIGAASTRFYSGSYNCTFIACTDYNSTTHFMGHIGGGVNVYVHGNFFIRPEAHLYFIHNNNEFSSGRVGRLGATLGYTF